MTTTLHTAHGATSGGAPAMQYRGIGVRAVALAVDMVAGIFGFGYAVAALTGGLTDNGFSLEGGPAMAVLMLVMIYMIAAEALFGATLGKLLFGLRVRAVDGARITLMQALQRNLARLVDGLLFYLPAAILVATSERRQRLGDRIAHTVVV